MTHTITLCTQQQQQIINVTSQLSEWATLHTNGLALFSVPHTTAALLISEDDEELRHDLLKVVRHLLADLRPFQHIKKDNPNSEAHIFSALVGCNIVIAINGGQLDLGTYQNMLLMELDGPKERQIRCTFMPIA